MALSIGNEVELRILGKDQPANLHLRYRVIDVPAPLCVTLEMVGVEFGDPSPSEDEVTELARAAIRGWLLTLSIEDRPLTLSPEEQRKLATTLALLVGD